MYVCFSNAYFNVTCIFICIVIWVLVIGHKEREEDGRKPAALSCWHYYYCQLLCIVPFIITNRVLLFYRQDAVPYIQFTHYPNIHELFSLLWLLRTTYLFTLFVLSKKSSFFPTFYYIILRIKHVRISYVRINVVFCDGDKVVKEMISVYGPFFSFTSFVVSSSFIFLN